MAAGSGAMMRMQAWSLTRWPAHVGHVGGVMVAMMVPSAAPMILIFARLDRSQGSGWPYAATTLFALGYVAVWGRVQRSGDGRCSGACRARPCSRR